MLHYIYLNGKGVKTSEQHFVKAQEAGEKAMDLEWKVHIGTRLQECLQSVLEASTSVVCDTRKKVMPKHYSLQHNTVHGDILDLTF